MSNRSSSKQHGLHNVKRHQPSKSNTAKAMKAAGRERQNEVQKGVQEAKASVAEYTVS